MKFLKLKVVIVFFSLFNLAAPAFATSNETLTNILNRMIADNQGVGISAAVIDKGKVQYLNYGLVNQANKTATTEQHLFEIGSVSKTFTTLALASMVKEGKIKLTDAVEPYLPKGHKLPKYSDKPITFLSLANHTSGLPSLPTDLKMSDPLNPYADYTIEQLYAFLASYKLGREVGEKAEYSNLGMGLLGHVLSIIDNKSYEQMISKRVTKPLGMIDTMVNVPMTKLNQFSDGHNAELKPTKHWDIPTLAGAGAIRSNIKDMVSYVKANMGGKDNSIYALAQQPTANFVSEHSKIGLGWITNQTAETSYIWHNGGTGGFRSFVGFDRTNQKAIILLSNSVHSVDAVGNAFLTGKLEQLWTAMNSELFIDKQDLDKLVGQYMLMPGFILTVSHDDKRLQIQATGQSKLPVYAKSKTKFFYKVVQAEVEFAVDSEGKATTLTLFQGGQELVGAKLNL